MKMRNASVQFILFKNNFIFVESEKKTFLQVM